MAFIIKPADLDTLVEGGRVAVYDEKGRVMDDSAEVTELSRETQRVVLHMVIDQDRVGSFSTTTGEEFSSAGNDDV